MADSYPNGYGTQLLSLAELRARHDPKMHPEYARRLFACLVAADGLVGIGGGWRSSQTQTENHRRAPNTFAPPGLSFHESQRFASGVEVYAAVDTVGRDGRHDAAWNWMRDNAGRFGLRTFWNVNGEPWHVQFVDLPNGVSSWTRAGRPDPAVFPLPDGAAASIAVSSDVALGQARQGFGAHPLNDEKPVLRIGWYGDLVRYVQRVIDQRAGGRIAVDGDFGPQTEGRVKDVQFVAELAPTGVVDWDGTWQMIDHLAGHTRPAPVRRDGSVTAGAVTAGTVVDDTVVEADRGYYWVQRGDSPWNVAARVYGDGARHVELEPCDPAAPGFTAADHHIRLTGVAGRTTAVAPGEGPLGVIHRLFPGQDPSTLLDRFRALNGGEYRVLHPGELVFLDDPAATTRGV